MFLSKLYNYLKLGLVMFYLFYPFVIPTIIWKTLRGRKHEVQIGWSTDICNFFNLRIHRVGSEAPANPGRMMYLFNHRSMADIFLHDVILEGRASFLSRYLVGVIFLTSLFFYESVWFFRRGINRNFDAFYRWLDGKFEASNRPHLLVYPEGHRMQGHFSPAPLKHGMLKYAYARRMPVQIGISFGNENACSESPPLINRAGTDIYYSMDSPIDTKTFATEALFIQEVETRFNAKYLETLQHYRAQTK
jgi:1-acyl-sn-glycerol-3-phosphate acyltransferase